MDPELKLISTEDIKTSEAPFIEMSEEVLPQETSSNLHKDISNNSEKETLHSEETGTPNNAVTSGISGELDEATSQLGKLKVKRIRLSGAQRKKAIKEKLAARGIPFDPKKWRPNRAAKKSGLADGTEKTPRNGVKRNLSDDSTPAPDTSIKKLRPEYLSSTSKEEEDTLKEALTSIKLAVVSDGFPAIKLSEDQGNMVKEALIGAFVKLDNGSFPQFTGSFMERGALFFSCANWPTKLWLESTVAKLSLWEDAKLIVKLTGDVLRTSKVFFKVLFKTPKIFLGMEPPKILKLLGNQNPQLHAEDWRIISAKDEYPGKTLICAVDDDAIKTIKALGNRAFLGLGKIFLVILGKNDTEEDNTDKPSA